MGASEHATVVHELTHANRMREDGWLVFLARWLLSAYWRTVYEAEGYAAGEITTYGARLPVTIMGDKIESGEELAWWYARNMVKSHRLRVAFGRVPPTVDRKRMLMDFVCAKEPLRGRRWPWLLPWAGLVGIVFALAGAWAAVVVAALLATLEAMAS